MAEAKETSTGQKKAASAKPERQRIMFPRPFEDLERWYESLLPRAWLNPLRGEWPLMRPSTLFTQRAPAVDLIDRDEDVVVRAEVPGVRKEDLKVSLYANAVTIEGHTESEEEEKRTDYYRREMTYGDFSRTVELPTEVDAAKAQATMKDGVLEIQIPKVEHAKLHKVNVEVH